MTNNDDNVFWLTNHEKRLVADTPDWLDCPR
jgi:hypothetical protein